MNFADTLLRPDDITPTLLCALSTLSMNEREAWIDTYVVGSRTRGPQSKAASVANEKLREWFGSPENIRRSA